MVEWITTIAGIFVIVIAGKLIFSNSQKGFVDRATRKGWVARGKLIRTYTQEGKTYGTYEYKIDQDIYSIDVECEINLYEEEPPAHMGIYYKGSNPQKACVREKNPRKKREQDRKNGFLFCIVLCIVVGIMKLVFDSN